MMDVLCWGQCYDDQEGQGGRILSPQLLTTTDIQDQIAQISCGVRHTLFLTTKGAVYSYGNNDYGQLGHDLSTQKPGVVSVLASHSITHVSCGENNSLALNEAGEVFSWGCNDVGQLGRDFAGPSEVHRKPRIIKFLALSGQCVRRIKCGYNHSLALTDTGVLFTWGSNTYGQLGVGSTRSYHDEPQRVLSLQGIPIAHIACGGYHSFILSLSGALFGWGKNSCGQLGIGDKENNEPNPVHCKVLRNQRVKYMDCGEDHTVILTADGGVFTFGDGTHGQLGHGSTNHERLPKKVFELMGSEVTQISCGRHHTLAMVSPSGNLYAFGQGDKGQLGVGQHITSLTPRIVEGPFGSHNKNNHESDKYVINYIESGGDRCLILVSKSEDQIPVCDMRVLNTSLLTLTSDYVTQLSAIPVDERLPVEASEMVEKIFTSPACLNASFLVSEDEHYCCSRKRPGVDKLAAFQTFSHLNMIGNQHINKLICDSIQNNLLPSMKTSPPDMEALRLYLILPNCRLFENVATYHSLIVTYGTAVLNLESAAAKVLDAWFKQLQDTHFTRLVEIFKKVVIYVLDLPPAGHSIQEVERRQRSLFVSMEMLKKLNQINTEASIVPYDVFYMSDLKDRVDIKMDYVRWLTRNNRIEGAQSHGLPLVSFCDYSFVLDGKAKTQLLQADAIIQMRNAIDEVSRRQLMGLFFNQSMIDPISPCLVLIVSRGNIAQSTLNQLAKHSPLDFKKPLKVVFDGEEAVDEGGVRKEFFMLIIKELMNPQYGMFREYESKFLWFNEMVFEDPAMFCMIGKICGLAIYNSILVDLHFPLALYKKLLKKPITLEDFKELDPSVGRSLEQMLFYEGSDDQDDFEDVFPLTFEISREVFGQVKRTPLIPRGDKIPVTKDNRAEYVDAYVKFVLDESVKEPFENFIEGFLTVCGGCVLNLFQPKELQAMVRGNENYDWDLLEANCQYKGEYCSRHQNIIFFWEVFRSLPLDAKKKFLFFLTGSDRIPIWGMETIKMVIQPVHVTEAYLPVAHTCFNLLDLPKYSNKEVMKDKLLKAIQYSEGFGLA